MVVALAAITVAPLATSAEARGRGYGCGAGFQTLATFPLTFLVVLIPRVSLLVPLLFTAPITLMSSGDTAT